MKLEGRIALVTGARRGIGRAIALALAREGADVAVHHHEHADEAEAVACAVRELGRRAAVVRADVSVGDEVRAMAEAVERSLGPVDICVNNAAMSIRKPFVELDDEDVRRVLAVSLIGPFMVSQACARQMIAHERAGVILMIGSVHAFIPAAQSLAYNTAKAGLKQMAYTMAEELLAHRIRVNVIEPGWIDTEGERAFASEQELREAGARMPWGRLGTSEEIAKAAVYLASDDADYVNATTLRVDGACWLPNTGGEDKVI